MPFIETDGRRVLFVHIPKTGGSTVEYWLQSIAPLRLHTVGLPPMLKCTPQHLRLVDIRSLLGQDYFTYMFALVRNPYDRIASEYRMRATIQRGSFFKLWPTFSLWLEDNLGKQTTNSFHYDNHLRPQWEFIGSGLEIFRLEDGVEMAVERAARHMGVSPPRALERKLGTADSGVVVEWDKSDRLRVQEHYARDFREFGYSM